MGSASHCRSAGIARRQKWHPPVSAHAPHV